MIRIIQTEDAEVISKAFQKQGWNKPLTQYLDYVRRNKNGEIVTVVCFIDDEFAGYGNLFFKSNHIPFLKYNIPEIVDLNTLIKFRNKGIASKILDTLEKEAFKVNDKVGIGVGLIKDYGPAQKLYVKRGYIPTVDGAYYSNKQINYFDSIKADDDLVLYFTKKVDK